MARQIKTEEAPTVAVTLSSGARQLVGCGSASRIALTVCWPAAATLPMSMRQHTVDRRVANRVSPMHRMFGLLALMAAGLGLYLLFGPDAEPRGSGMQAMQNAPVAYSGWALGLVMGLTLAWLAGVDWSNLPARVVLWVRLQRRRLWLAVLGSVFASILLLF